VYKNVEVGPDGPLVQMKAKEPGPLLQVTVSMEVR